MEKPDMQATLQSCRFLKNISPAHLDTISGFCSVDHYEAGTYIFRQGDFGEDLFIIIEGYVFLERAMDIGSHKGSVVIDALGKGKDPGMLVHPAGRTPCAPVVGQLPEGLHRDPA
jgi:CRP/FNR family cyclic AMP-dependent transcriptional regulator